MCCTVEELQSHIDLSSAELVCTLDKGDRNNTHRLADCPAEERLEVEYQCWSFSSLYTMQEMRKMYGFRKKNRYYSHSTQPSSF